MQKTYDIGFTRLGKNSDLLVSNSTIITGKNGCDALLRYYGQKFKRDAGTACDVVITECRIVDGRPVLCGRRGGYSLAE